MQNLLKNEFVDYWYAQCTDPQGITLGFVRSKVDIEIHTTHETYFEISDVADNLVLSQNDTGTSRYINNKAYSIEIINYDKFLSSLPYPINPGKMRCDSIIYPVCVRTDFLLVELKSSKNKKQRLRANEQIIETLETLTVVPEVQDFIKTFVIKRCCEFIKKAKAPRRIKVSSSFRRAKKLLVNGKYVQNADIEAYGFELYRYYDSQVYTFD
jgi:hypothetical protein